MTVITTKPFPATLAKKAIPSLRPLNKIDKAALPKNRVPLDKRAIKKMNAKARLTELKKLINICFYLIHETEQDLKEISNLSGISVTTLRRLVSDKLTLAVRFGTIQALAFAAGLKVSIDETSYRVRLVD